MQFDHINPNHTLGAYPMNPRKWGGLRKHCGPYRYRRDADSEGFSYYLGSDFEPDLRWQWCDEIISSIRHTGWFIDDYQGETLRGIVLRLPGGRGFLAGWSMGEGMIAEISRDIISDETDAAYQADSMAENAAEREREYQAEQDREREIEERAEIDAWLEADLIAA